MAQNLHQQPAGITAGAGSQFECFIGGLHTGLHAHQVTNVALQLLIDQHQKIGNVAAGYITPRAKTIEPSLQQWPRSFFLQIGRQLGRKLIRVGKRKLFRVGLDKKIERIDHRHVGNQIHRNAEFPRLVGKYQTCDVIAIGVLLPIDKVFFRRDAQRIAEYRRTAMGRGPQANFVWRNADQTIETIMRFMIECDTNSHNLKIEGLTISAATRDEVRAAWRGQIMDRWAPGNGCRFRR